MELVGSLLGNRYEILENVGNGGMATVYKAKDKILNRRVAIKVLKDEFANDQEFIKRFQIEAQSAASLSHPNIVSIYDVANEGDIHYIVMELIEGETLKEIIKKEGKLDWRRSAEIASQIASGLSTAHKNHIVHRDIKPHNIIITKEGIAKITDFGIAKATSSSTINANANSLGSVHYFSPEHARGGYTDEKSDIYSLGVVLYEMITGKLPFDGDTAVAVAMKHLKDKPTSPKELVPSIPEGINNIIEKAMQKESGNRYSSASSMYNDLQKVLKDPTNTEVGEFSEGEAKFATQRIPTINRNMNSNVSRDISSTKENYGGKMENKTKKKPSRTKSNPAMVALVRLLLILLIFGICVGIGYMVFNALMGGSENQLIEVPNVIGDSELTAEQRLQSVGFKMEIEGQQESNLPKGYIAWQKFASGDKKARGTTINVRTSSGPKKILVPDLVGLSVNAAGMKLDDADLVMEVQEEESDKELDKIVRQVPEANTEIDSGSTITVFVSIGTLPHVPDVSEMTEAEAIKAIEEVYMVANVRYVNIDTFPDKKIIQQSTPAGEIAVSGDVITLIINDHTWVDTTPVDIEDNPDNPTEPVIDNPDKPTEKDNTETNPTPTPTPKPEETKPDTPSQPIEQVPDKELKINLTNKGSRNSFTVKVLLNGDIRGRTNIYEGTHTREDKEITVTYPGDATGLLRVYIDGVLDSEMVLE